jgi:Alkyl sulfatase and related hydrolases
MKTGSNGLSYPFDNRPNPGELFEVGPGIFWVRMPLPISLNHINLWMLEEQDGWTLVDTGMATEDTKALWEEIFSTHLNSKPVKQVIVTHMHFDHLGLAGWLVEKWGATLCMSRTEYLSSRVIINEIKSDPPETTVAFFRAAGVEESILDEFKFDLYRSDLSRAS